MKRILSFLLLLPLFVTGQTPVSNNFQINAPKAIDSRTHKLTAGVPITSIPYASVAEANAAIALDRRYEGLTVCIGTASNCTEHWYHGGTANANLVMKLVAPDWGLATTPLPVNKGGTGVTTPGLVAGNNVSITGTWPNQTISAAASGGGADSAVYQTRYRSDSMFRRRARIYNVIDYGWVSDSSVSSGRRASNKAAAEAAIAAAAANGGGRIIFPSGTGFADPIHIPAYPLMATVDGRGTRTLVLEGESTPSFLFGTVGTGVLPNGGSIIRCLSTDPNEAVFYQNAGTDPAYGYFSGVTLYFKNLDIRTPNNPRIAGIHAGYAACLKVEDCAITNGVYSVDASEPTYSTGTGIVTPYINNGALTILDNVAVSGMANGIEVNEHAWATYLNLTCNLNALRFKTAYHLSYFARVAAQRNTYNIVVDGQHRFRIGQLNIEHANVSQTNSNNAWQLTQYDFYDPGNASVGALEYGVVLGAVGPDNTFTRLGNGPNFCTHPIGTPECVVPTGRTITINGVTQDLSSSRSWTVSADTTGLGLLNRAAAASLYSTKQNLADTATGLRAAVNLRAPTNAPIFTASLEIQSTTGFFYPPRMTAAQASALSPTAGACFFATTTNGTFTAVGLWYYDGSIWKQQ